MSYARRLVFTLIFLMPLGLLSQTTEEEFNYANGGYLKLQELGYGTKPNYKFENVLNPAPLKAGESLGVLALVRESSRKTAAAIITSTNDQGATQVRWVICEPRTVWSLERKSFEQQNLFPAGTDSSTLAFTYRMFQQALWPEQVGEAENKTVSTHSLAATEANEDLSDFVEPATSFFLPGRTSVTLPEPAQGCNAEGTVVVKIFVNREGKVIYAQAGVNIPNGPRSDYDFNSCLLIVTKEAAMASTFDPFPNSVHNSQQGYIVYKF